MNKVIFTVVIVLFSINFSYAGVVGENLGGCGISSKFFADRDELLPHFFVEIFNMNPYSTTSQTSSVTSERDGCKEWKGLVNNTNVDKFISENMSNLSHDISIGGGEYVETLSVLMEIPEENRSAFINTLQQNFNTIYSSPEVTSHEVAENIEKVING